MTEAERIAELEAQVADLTARLAKRSHCNLEKLKAYKEANPEKAKESSSRSSKKHREANRDAYNARRRELYRQKKDASEVTAVTERP